jgi:hypothetical protein
MARRRGRRLPPRGRGGRFIRRGSRRRGGRRGARSSGFSLMKMLPIALVGGAIYLYFANKASAAAPAGLINVANRVVSPEEALLMQTQPG